MGKHAKPEEIVAKLRQFEVPTAQVSWSPKFGQVVKVGSTERKDGPDDGQAEAVFG